MLNYCELCGSRADKHHIISRGAGGCGEPYNILWLCRGHHIEIHFIGWKTFSEKYDYVKEKIISARLKHGRRI